MPASPVIKLGIVVVDEVRRRVQQDTPGPRGQCDDPLHRSRNILRAGGEELTGRQWARLTTALDSRPEHEEVGLASGFRHPRHHRLRMLLSGGGLTDPRLP